jgi:hypothetical protein
MTLAPDPLVQDLQRMLRLHKWGLVLNIGVFVAQIALAITLWGNI